MKVYTLNYALDPCESSTVLGIFSSRERAEAARDLPAYGHILKHWFNVHEYELDETRVIP